MGNLRIVVADQTEAVFYETASLRAEPREIARIRNPAGQKQERELVTDRPGRGHSRFGTNRYSMSNGSTARREYAERFARRIARRLDKARRSEEFGDLIVVAGPTFLGLMRENLSPLTRARVVHEVRKDLVRSPVQALRTHLPTRRAELSVGTH
jgi:protein required for attachment to host cells